MRLAIVLIAVLVAGVVAPADAAELVMFRRAGCPWCAAWDREIAPIYPKTDLGKRLTLKFVDLDGPAAFGIVLANPVRYTPTFVVVDKQREVGRIEGYPGNAFFWSMLERLAARTPDSAAASDGPLLSQ